MKVNEFEDCNRPNRMFEFAKRHKMPIILSSIGAIILAGGIAILNRPCPHDGKLHQHHYKLEKDGYHFLKGSSLEVIPGWEKEDEVTFDDVSYKYDKANNKNLFSIKDNREELAKYEKRHPSHIEYEYWYFYKENRYDTNGTLQQVDAVGHNWTSSKYFKNLNGNTQQVIQSYRGIKIDQNGNDVYGPWVSSIDEITSEYIYMDYPKSFKTEYIKLERTYQK